MAPVVEADRQLLKDRRCYVCLRAGGEELIYDVQLHGLLCPGECNKLANSLTRIHDNSTRGRWRPTKEWKELLRAHRRENVR